MARSKVLATVAVLAVLGCTNNPYPDADRHLRVLYTSFSDAPKTLDPAVSYTTAEHIITGSVFDTLLEYQYLKRPYELMPGLAEAVPEPQALPGGRYAYRFKLRPGVLFHADPCFALSQQGGPLTREAVSADYAFQLARIADPAVNSPVISTFAQVVGFAEFTKRLVDRRKGDEAFAALPAHEQYKRAGGIEGVVAGDDHTLDIILEGANPQLLYWFAMPFTTPMPWEAVAMYDGKAGHAHLADHPVGTGPFRLTVYAKQFRFVLERNETWYGSTDAGRGAPAAVFPSAIDPEDIAAGRIDPAYAGRRLPFLDRVSFAREREDIPRFNKFLQGYYDDSGIVKESFDAVVQNDRLSPAMAARGMRLDKEVEPTIYYLGFNMNDPVLGARNGERGRKLRQAMSLVIDTEEFLKLFLNGRGVPAQSPLPPGIFGYDPNYKNPYRRVDLIRARKLIEEAGYRNGIDPATGRPLKLTFDTGNTTAQAQLQYDYMASAWGQLGLEVQIAATTYNQFQDKVRRGAYQIFRWGWQADFPDPENFFFLLTCENAVAKSGGPNSANFCNPDFDRLYREMKDLPNNARRASLIKDMIAILEHERPWIELHHNEDYTLTHAWLINSKPMGMSNPAYKYKDVKPELRARLQAEWNTPVRWPLYVGLIGIIALIIPAVRTYYRERS